MYSNRNYDIVNLMDAWKNFIVAGILSIPLWNSTALPLDMFSFFYDWKFYLIATMGVCSNFIMRKAFKANEQNMTLMAFLITFSPMVATPLLVFFIGDLIGFKDTLKIQYESAFEVYVFVTTLIILSGLYGYDKFRSKVVYRKDLILLMLLMSSIMPAFVVKMMQSYNPAAFYLSTLLINASMFLAVGVAKRQYRNVQNRWLPFLVPPMLYVAYTQFNLVIFQSFAAEQSIILRCGLAIIFGACFDYILHKKWNLRRKDSIVVSMILAVCAFFLIYR